MFGSNKAVDLNKYDGEKILKSTMESYNFTFDDYDTFRNFCGNISFNKLKAFKFDEYNYSSAFNDWEIPKDCSCKTATFIGCRKALPPTSYPKNVRNIHQLCFKISKHFQSR